MIAVNGEVGRLRGLQGPSIHYNNPTLILVYAAAEHRITLAASRVGTGPQHSFLPSSGLNFPLPSSSSVAVILAVPPPIVLTIPFSVTVATEALEFKI